MTTTIPAAPAAPVAPASQVESRTAAGRAVPGVYERLGISPVINGAATLTRLGGSLMPEPVVRAMVEAAGAFVPLDQLQVAAGRRLAELTRNEAAYVTSGAAAGLTLATAACVTGGDAEKMALLPRPERIPGGRHKVVIFRAQRNGYDFAVRQVGIELVEVGPTRAEAAGRDATIEELEAALDERTACVVWFSGALASVGSPPLREVVRAAHARGVPVVVDAAAQIPAAENLWLFTGEAGPQPWASALAALGLAPEPAAQTEPVGADLVIFSGGKGLCGPQSSGLLLGRKDLVEAAARQGNPNAFIGRPMKVGKEEICGLVAAVEWYLSQDFTALARLYEQQVRHVIDAVAGIEGVTAERVWPSEAGQPMPRALVRLTGEGAMTRDALQAALKAESPAIELSSAGTDGVYVNPQTLRPGEEEIVASALRSALLSRVPAGAAG
jgi:seryl-tRNA(Sec) selenium transferase